MKIYVAHSTSFDYKTELYEPLKEISIPNLEIYLPHDAGNDGKNSKDIIASCDYVIAEVSYPSTGVGIELGWANEKNVAIMCVYKSGTKYSKALHAVSETFIAYDSVPALINKLRSYASLLII